MSLFYRIGPEKRPRLQECEVQKTAAVERQVLNLFAGDDTRESVAVVFDLRARGLDGLWGMYQWLDRAPLGRNERGVWWRHHDQYPAR